MDGRVCFFGFRGQGCLGGSGFRIGFGFSGSRGLAFRVEGALRVWGFTGVEGLGLGVYSLDCRASGLRL